MLVSMRNGSRERSCQSSSFSSAEPSNSLPVKTKPRSSSSTAPWSQPVLARAPMKTKSARAPRARLAPERLSSTVIPSRWSSPESSRISVPVSSSTFSAREIRSTRYLDMLLPRSSPLMSRYTFLVRPAKNIAAWPAELPPPTTTTSSSGYLRPAVAGPARGYHAARCDLDAVGEQDAEVAVLPPQADRLPWHGGAGAELVGLDQDAAGELETGEAGGEARVILYARGGASLTSQRHRLQGEGGETFRSTVDRGAKARWSRTNHHEVVSLFQGGAHLEARGPGKFGHGRLLEHVFTLPDGHRRLRRLRAELLEQRFGCGVVLEPDPDVGYSVAGRDLPEA